VDVTSLPGEVTVVHGPRKVVYYGKRNGETLARFVQKLSARYLSTQQPFQIISNKLEKKAFERLVVPKVVAYFPDTTAPAFAEYQAAARQLTPNPPFYVVHDPKVSITLYCLHFDYNSICLVCQKVSTRPAGSNCTHPPTGEVDHLLPI